MHPGSHSELRLLLAFVLLLTFGQAYDSAALLVKLKAIPVENGTLAEVEEELRSVCGKEGIILVVAKSSRVDDGSSNGVDMKKIVCQRAGTVSYTHLRAHETEAELVCRLLLEKNRLSESREREA